MQRLHFPRAAFFEMRQRRVGIDLAAAGHFAAPGTVRHVQEQARALFRLPVDWEWLPTFESKNNPLWNETQHLNPIVAPGAKLWSRAFFGLGEAWKRTDCDLGFSTAYFVPQGNLPVIANFFDSNIYEHFGTWLRSGRILNALLIRLLSTHAIRRSKALFVNSHYCIDYLRRKFPNHAEKFKYAPPGICLPSHLDSPRPAWAENISKEFFLFVGVFSANKNQHSLISAWNRAKLRHPGLPDLVLVGRDQCSSSYHRQLILPALSSSPDASRIIRTGVIPDEELVWAYHHALAYIQPSIAEGFGLPIAEAMSYGLPVACSNTTSLPETAGGAALLFDPYDIEQIAAVLIRLHHDEVERNRLKNLGQKRWKEFTWKKNAEVIVSEIETLLRTKNTPSP